MIQENDFKIFQQEVSWFTKPTSSIQLKKGDIRLSIDFEEAFPKLASLIKKARITVAHIDQAEYLLFAWDTKQNLVCGWLNEIVEPEAYFCEMIPEHELLIRMIGGIRESFNQPEESFTNNQNFMFLGTECFRGIGGWDDYYNMMCEDEKSVPIDFSSLLVFAQEANGALTLYDPSSKKVLLFSHDHSFDNVDFMMDQPEYTFHYFKAVVTFVDYVEELATQWLNATK
jgi:hypothetical protein